MEALLASTQQELGRARGVHWQATSSGNMPSDMGPRALPGRAGCPEESTYSSRPFAPTERASAAVCRSSAPRTMSVLQRYSGGLLLLLLVPASVSDHLPASASFPNFAVSDCPKNNNSNSTFPWEFIPPYHRCDHVILMDCRYASTSPFGCNMSRSSENTTLTADCNGDGMPDILCGLETDRLLAENPSAVACLSPVDNPNAWPISIYAAPLAPNASLCDYYGETGRHRVSTEPTEPPTVNPHGEGNWCIDDPSGWNIEASSVDCEHWEDNEFWDAGGPFGPGGDCGEFGESRIGTDGRTANQACCSCGGGRIHTGECSVLGESLLTLAFTVIATVPLCNIFKIVRRWLLRMQLRRIGERVIGTITDKKAVTTGRRYKSTTYYITVEFSVNGDGTETCK